MLSEVPAIDRLLLALPRVTILDRVLMQSGLDWTVAKFLFMSLMCAAGAFVALSFLHVIPLLELAAVSAGAFLPLACVQWKRSRRLRRMEQQLPDALDLIGRAMGL